MEIYGETGYIFAENRNDMKIRGKNMKSEEQKKITSNDVAVYEDPFAYFADVIHNKITMPEYGLYSMKNNVEVVRILDAARESAKTGKTVLLKY
jgi:predicted dehydrogenase